MVRCAKAPCDSRRLILYFPLGKEGLCLEYLGLYFEFYKIKLKSIAQYRASFFMTTFSKAASYLSRFIVVWIMINTFRTMGTWSTYEVLLLYGLNSASYAIAGAFFYHITVPMKRMVGDGTMDEILTKPLNPFIYLAARNFSTGYFGTFFISLFLIVFCLLKLEISFTAGKLLLLAAAFLSGGLITGSFMLITSIPSFWMIRNSALPQLFFHTPSRFSEYPLSIFNKAIQFVLTVLLPFAFVTYYPALLILGKQDLMLFPAWVSYLTPAVAVLLFVIAYRFWFYGLKRYNSTGS